MVESRKMLVDNHVSMELKRIASGKYDHLQCDRTEKALEINGTGLPFFCLVYSFPVTLSFHTIIHSQCSCQGCFSEKQSSSVLKAKLLAQLTQDDPTVP